MTTEWHVKITADAEVTPGEPKNNKDADQTVDKEDEE